MAKDNNVIGYVFIAFAIMFSAVISSNYPFPGYFEPYSGALVQMEFEHERVHTGEGFQASGRILNLAAGATELLIMNTTDDGIHWRSFSLTCDAAPILVQLHENPIITDYGDLLTSYNRNRFSLRNSSANLYVNGTLGTAGTVLMTDEIIGDKQTAGSSGAIALEWILKSNTTYAIVIINNNGNGVNCVWSGFWYELHN